ncbi:MAG TPA: 4Fe-4S dicluster domain-containing protein [bacterium (Candidatus Stahlbacteria)]|nr:4Fe-4S dicluster domain-containing protein [Candidatus Stahlbacteria bacterium]
MGQWHEVPASLTIQKALEYAGYQLTRGCGCRGGFCGACATVYRTEGDYRLKVGLACQTIVEDGMYLTLLPFYPAQRADYDISKLEPTYETIVAIYPEVLRCVGCNTCTKVCPQDIDVMEYIACAKRGDIAKLADLSFDCVMCGLCASKCPAEIAQYNVAILGRRLYGKYLAPKAKHLADMVEALKKAAFDKEIQDMLALSEDELKRLYAAREIES